MFNLNEFLVNEYENEYGNEYNLPMKKKYSEPKIYNANGDLSKRWYVYYRFRNPETDELQKMPSIYLGANNYKTKAERLSILTSFKKNLSKLLKQGYNPFQDNQELYNELEGENKIIETKIEQKPKQTIYEAIQFVITLKRQSLSATSFRGLNNRINNFLEWLEKNKSELISINQLNKKTVTEFLNYILNKTSPANRNNFRSDLSSVIQILEDNEIIDRNFVKSIPILKSTPTRNKSFSEKQLNDIIPYLEKNDKILLLFINFISYSFLRPIEICRLKIKDINIDERKIYFKAKNSPLKTKIIPEILIKEIPDLTNLNSENFLFTPNKLGDECTTKENNRRNYFSKRFKINVKHKFHLGVDYGLYSFRHTFITKLYYEFRKNLTDFEAKSKLLLITGHSTMTALEKYLRTIDAELPEDYSEMLK